MEPGSGGCPCTDHRSPAIDRRLILNGELPSYHLVVNKEGTVTVLEGGVCVQHSVVRFNQGCRHLGEYVNTHGSPGKLRPEELGRWKSQAWISFRSQRKDAPEAGMQNQTQCHLRRRGRPRNPEGLMHRWSDGESYLKP